MMRVKPKHDQVLIRPDAGLHARIHNAHIENGMITSAVFGQVRIDNPLHYRVTGKLNQVAFGHVLAIGPGMLYGPSRDTAPASPGDVVCFDLGQVGTCLPDGSYMLSWKNLLARIVPDDEYPIPCLNQVMTRVDPDLASSFAFQRSHSDGIKLHAPHGAMLKGNDLRSSRSKYVVDRCFRVGTGRYVKKVFETVDLVPGEPVILYSFKSVDLAWKRGELFRFTEFGEVLAGIEGL